MYLASPNYCGLFTAGRAVKASGPPLFQITLGNDCSSLCGGKQIISNGFQSKADAEHDGVIFRSPLTILDFS